METYKFPQWNKPVITGLLILLSCGQTLAQPVQPIPYAKGHPPMISGITIEPLENHQVPDILKNQALLEIEQMKAQGYVDARSDEVGYLNYTKEKKDLLKPLNGIQSDLKISPATINGVPLAESVVKVLGVVPSGVRTPEGWTAVSRLFVEKKLGLMMLNEIDYIASGGGMIMIKEAINQNINGRPAILRLKTDIQGHSITELTWATDRKIYTLSANRAVNGAAINAMISFAESLHD